MICSSRMALPGAYNVQAFVPRDPKGHAAMSLVLTAGYRVPDFDRWWAVLSRAEIPPMFAGEVVEKLDLGSRP
jgi:hypothetical protein